MKQQSPTVFVIDDDVSIREGLQNLFRSVGLDVKTFASGQEFLAQANLNQEGCIVLDVRLPGMSGLDLQERLSGEKIALPVIFITAHADIPMSVRAMKAGAIEFLEKPFRDQDLLDAVQHAIDRDLTARAAQGRMDELRMRYQSLTVREQEVMAFVVHGLANKEIATALSLSEATVKVHRGRLMSKMNADSLGALVRIAEKLDIAEPRRED